MEARPTPPSQYVNTTTTTTTQGPLEMFWPKQALAAFTLPSFIEGRQRGQTRELLHLSALNSPQTPFRGLSPVVRTQEHIH